VKQVVLGGFEASADKYLTCGKGIDPKTNQALGGAMMGSYCDTKTQDYSHKLSKRIIED
jgi:hypothetical protein